MTAPVTSVVLAGVAGQPVLETARVLAEAALQAGLDVRFAECPSPLACGGPVSVHVRFGGEVRSPLVRDRGADVLVAFEQLEGLRAARLLTPDAFAAVSSFLAPTWRVRAGLEPPPDVLAQLRSVTPRVVPVPTEWLAQAGGDAAGAGIVLLGLVSPLLPIPLDAHLAVLRGSERAGAGGRRLAFGRGRERFASLPREVTAAARQRLDNPGERR